jgi:hypothetical protein
MCTQFWLEIFRQRAHLEDVGIDGTNIKLDFREVDCNDVDRIYHFQNGVQCHTFKTVNKWTLL